MKGIELFSIRMRASAQGRHISGAERIIPAGDIPQVFSALYARAQSKGAPPEQIVITIENLANEGIERIPALDVATCAARDYSEARSTAAQVLESLGVSRDAVFSALQLLAKGPSSTGGVMRGAMVINAETGARLEPDQDRGIRASRFDWEPAASAAMDDALASAGLTHFRIKEALALASKAAHAPGIVAELCWSDDPDYTAGYVASSRTGYIRFPMMKPQGSAIGGRAFFVTAAGFSLAACTGYLCAQTVLINAAGRCKAPSSPAEVLAALTSTHDEDRTNRSAVAGAPQ